MDPLYIAIRYDKIDEVGRMLHDGYDPNKCDDSTADRPLLHTAIMYGYAVMVELLLSHKANPNSIDRHLTTPLHITSKADVSADIMALLIRHGADVNAIDMDGLTPLHEKCRIDDPRSIDMLLKQGAATNARSKHGITPLHIAASHFASNVIFDRLLTNGANKDAKDDDGNTPLHLAAYIGHINGVKYLLSHGADPHITNNDGETYDKQVR